jgi:integrase
MKSKLSIDQVVKLVRDLTPPKPKTEITIPDPMQPGFGIRLLPSGVATWIIRYRSRGRQTRAVIGDVLTWTRKEALQEARHMLLRIQSADHDPHKAKRDAAESAKRTFEVVVAEFIERKEELRRRSGTLRDYRRYLRDKYHFEPFHKRPFDEIGGDEFKEQIKVIKHTSGNETALACHAAVKHLYEWAAETGNFPDHLRNPLDKVEAPVKNRPRERVLSPDEIRILWKACDDWEAQVLDIAAKGIKREPGGFNILTDYPRAAQLLLLTGMRSKEMGDLHWSEVTLPDPDKDGIGKIILGKHRTKEGRQKVIPLVSTAVEIFHKIEKRPGDPCVFGRGDGRPYVVDDVPWKEGLSLGDTKNKIMKRLKRGDTGFWKHQLDPEQKARIQYLLSRGDVSMTRIRIEEKIRFQTIQAIKAEMEAKRAAKEAGPPVLETPAPAPPTMDPWTIHDLRRTFRTGLSECGVTFEIAERIVGHLTEETRNRTAITYDLYNRWSEMCEAVTEWETRLKSILGGTEQEMTQRKDREAA